ncbi:bifunctional diguanylate cyclase/phosphodiesterase [Aureimonas sp. SK2]|uniref:putative bifunctional diguanylate cyclase/phosphodiesterase n=1 Tax=Aureimonas sp. SK2 TaxID=3015992 RepID=UPI00244386F2|nr:EAL domain-containing protein [Aureimonas sp. SK2]
MTHGSDDLLAPSRRSTAVPRSLADDLDRVARFAREVLEAAAVRVRIDHVDGGTSIHTAGVVSSASVTETGDMNSLAVSTGDERTGTFRSDVCDPDGSVIGSIVIERPGSPALERAECRVLAGLARHVGERVEAARRIDAEASQRFESIATSSPDAIVTANGRNEIVAWNAGAERLFGYAPSEVLGQSLSLIVPPAMRGMHEAGLGKLASGGEPKLIGQSVKVRACRKDGSEFPIELSLSRWIERGEQRFGAIIRDMSERVQTETELREAAATDPLTGLANRGALNKRLADLLAVERPVSLLLIDLDGFKEVNDTLGHPVGDAVLVEVASRIREGACHFGLCARMGGDEFVVLMEDTANPMDARWLGETLIDAIEIAIGASGALVTISACVGVACTGDCGTDAGTLIANADLALYRAKAEGRGRTRLFTPDLRNKVAERGLARRELGLAWDTGSYELYYQPQVLIADGSVRGAEALLRWNHRERGLLAPGAFLPMLESDATALAVGDWILETACRQAAHWRSTIRSDFRIAVNLFPIQFKSGDLVQNVEHALRAAGLSPDGLEIEITETTILKSDERILSQLQRLRALGVSLAFDDFGTGFASLSMLRKFPVTKIKIDRSFVSGPDVDDRDVSITQAMIQMADGLGMSVVAEGIETLAQHDLMRRQGCDWGQGYLYGRPMPALGFERAAEPDATEATARLSTAG